MLFTASTGPVGGSGVDGRGVWAAGGKLYVPLEHR